MRGDIGAAVGDRIVRKARDELADGLLRVGADLLGVGADEATRENAAGEPRDVVPLERLERAHRNLGGLGDIAQRDPALFAEPFHPLAEVARSLVHLRRCYGTPVGVSNALTTAETAACRSWSDP